MSESLPSPLALLAATCNKIGYNGTINTSNNVCLAGSHPSFDGINCATNGVSLENYSNFVPSIPMQTTLQDINQSNIPKTNFVELTANGLHNSLLLNLFGVINDKGFIQFYYATGENDKISYVLPSDSLKLSQCSIHKLTNIQNANNSPKKFISCNETPCIQKNKQGLTCCNIKGVPYNTNSVNSSLDLQQNMVQRHTSISAGTIPITNSNGNKTQLCTTASEVFTQPCELSVSSLTNDTLPVIKNVKMVQTSTNSSVVALVVNTSSPSECVSNQFIDNNSTSGSRIHSVGQTISDRRDDPANNVAFSADSFNSIGKVTTSVSDDYVGVSNILRQIRDAEAFIGQLGFESVDTPLMETDNRRIAKVTQLLADRTASMKSSLHGNELKNTQSTPDHYLRVPSAISVAVPEFRKRNACKCPNCLAAPKNIPGIRRTHMCDICGKSYGKTSHLVAHVRWHRGIRPFKCDWNDCTRSFTRSDELRRHLKIHTGEKNYKCDHCDKLFMRSDHLHKHSKVHSFSK